MRSTVLAFVAASFVVGCDSTGERDLVCGQRPVEESLQPLEVGNYWDYELVYTDSRVASRYRTEVIGRLVGREVDGSPVFVVRNEPIDRPYTEGPYDLVANTPLGFQNLGYIRDADTVWVDLVTYPYPAEIGQVFGETPEYEVLSLNHETRLPIGEFNTIVYEAKQYWIDDIPAPTRFFQYAPGIGLVAISFDLLPRAGDSRAHTEIRLTDFCLMQ